MELNTDAAVDERWYDGVAAEIRSKLRPCDEGAVWVLFADECRVVQMAMAIEPDGTELGALEYDSLTQVIGDVDAPTVLIAVPRADGIPFASDWRLWEEMRGRLEALTRSELIDLVVVGAESWWAVIGRWPDRAS
ncbi:MAG: hypothetical protein ACRDV3_17210 [Acidothermaceae bacterium]